ncbi:MAG: hypothetical protein PHN33_02315 [Candidatus Peribacteraceae bacterium]|nr:hypothetical protein [Candidatus Peribacteraceae bacterium]
MENNNAQAGNILTQNAPLTCLDHGILERLDPDSGVVMSTVFDECVIIRCRVGESMYARGGDGKIHTSPITARRDTPQGFIIHTGKEHHVYRFTRREPPAPKPAVLTPRGFLHGMKQLFRKFRKTD